MWEGDTTNIKPGKYLIKDNLSPKQVLKIIVTGVKEVTVKVTLPEGKNMLEYFELIAQSVSCRHDETPEKPCPHITTAEGARGGSRATRSSSPQHAIAGDTRRGLPVPRHLRVPRRREAARACSSALVTRHQEVWHELRHEAPGDTAKLKDKLSWSDRDILTMASIVEKEAVEPAERPRIAQVFINRLTKPDLQAAAARDRSDDPLRLPRAREEERGVHRVERAVREADLPVGCDRLHRAQLDDNDNPYNTYQPRGPAAGPDREPGHAARSRPCSSPDGTTTCTSSRRTTRARVLEDVRRARAQRDEVSEVIVESH